MAASGRPATEPAPFSAPSALRTRRLGRSPSLARRDACRHLAGGRDATRRAGRCGGGEARTTSRRPGTEDDPRVLVGAQSFLDVAQGQRGLPAGGPPPGLQPLVRGCSQPHRENGLLPALSHVIHRSAAGQIVWSGSVESRDLRPANSYPPSVRSGHRSAIHRPSPAIVRGSSLASWCARSKISAPWCSARSA